MRFRSELIRLDLLLAISALSSSSTTAQQVSGQGRTRKVGDAKSVEDILEYVHDEVAEYDQQAEQGSTKDGIKLLRKHDADVGVLANAKKTNPQFSIRNLQSASCKLSFIDCVNGFVKGSGNTITCKDACAGSCCVGNSDFPDACKKFTGKICKDKSCSGAKACTYASIKSVVNSCQGDFACYKAAVPCPYPTCGTYNAVTGSIGPVVNSCNDDYACQWAGSTDGRIASIKDSCNGIYACINAGGLGGKIQSIENSCNDERACQLAGRRGSVGAIKNSCIGYTSCIFAGDNGFVGSITDSCSGIFACAEIGAFGGGIGGVQSIKDSCKGDSSCSHAATNGGSIGSMRDSCIGDQACNCAGCTDGTILSINESCIGANSCSEIGAAGGTVGKITAGSCIGENACFFAGRSGGIGSISQSCDEASACSSAGAAIGTGDGTGPIVSDLKGCCNGVELCKGANEATLPLDC